MSCRGQMEQQMKMKEVAITDLQQKVGHLKEEGMEDRLKWNQKVILHVCNACNFIHDL